MIPKAAPCCAGPPPSSPPEVDTTWSDELEALRAETRRFSDALKMSLADVPPLETTPPQVSRYLRMSGEGAYPAPVFLDHAEDRVIGTGASIPVRVIVPDTVNGVYLHFHGGGWVLGNRSSQDEMLDRVARRANVAVVSVEYPLAPEHPYPAGPDACEEAALWLAENSAAQFDTTNLVIGGDSAGAHLAALTLVRLRDRHDAARAYKGANLIYGWYDLTLTPSAARWDEQLVLTPGSLRWFCDCFLGARSMEERRAPEISPMYADLVGLPPALFTAGTRDPLIDDSLFMAARWELAGNQADLALYPEEVHGFAKFPSPSAAIANDRCDGFVRNCVS